MSYKLQGYNADRTTAQSRIEDLNHDLCLYFVKHPNDALVDQFHNETDRLDLEDMVTVCQRWHDEFCGGAK